MFKWQTLEEENARVLYIECMVQCGFPLSVEDVLGYVYCITKNGKGKGHFSKDRSIKNVLTCV